MPQKSKITHQEVYDYVKSKGCTLLTESYKNMKQKLEVKCSCGEDYQVTLDSFKFRNRNVCRKCANKKLSKSKTSPSKYVKEYISNQGCELISEYTNAKAKLEIKCSCGELFERSFNKFKNGQTRCNACVGRKNWTYDNVKNYIETESNSGCVLLTDTFKNRNQSLSIECKCGNVFNTSFHSFLNSDKRKCEECSRNIQRKRLKKGIDYLRLYVVENSNSILTSNDYDNYHHKLSFECNCGNPYETSFVSFMNGKKQCNTCSPASKLEFIAESYFIHNNIKYQSQYSYDNLLSPKGRKLKFDFAILNNDEKVKFILELDGEQHFKASDGFGGLDKFTQTQLHDKLKDDFCARNGIILYRFTYKEIDNLKNILSDIINKHDNPVPSL